MALTRALSVLVHGETKVGKTTLAITAPYPRLMFDVEAGHRFLPINAVKWDPKTQEPPVPDGTWDTCVVDTRDYDSLLKGYEYLKLGRHQFKSVIIDSLSELQTKCKEQIVGRQAMKTQDWGELGRIFAGMMRDLRDLTEHPTNPLEAVVLTAMSKEKDGKFVPYLEGASGTVAPYLFDVIGYVCKETYPNPDPTQPQYTVRRMYVDEYTRALVGERVRGKLGSIIEQSDLSIDMMLDKIFGPRPGSGTTASASDG